MKEYPVRVAGTGSYLPGDPVKFNEITDVLGELNDIPEDLKKWCKRTAALMYGMLGMENYYYAIDRKTGACNDTPSGLAVKAARRALEMADVRPEEIELVIFGASSVDSFVCPPTSANIQEQLGIKRCAEMTINSNCTATYKGLQVARDLIANGRYRSALVCSSNLASAALRADFFNQSAIRKEQLILRWFLCDGGGAMVLKADEEPRPGMHLIDTYVESVGPEYPTTRHPSPMYSLAGSGSGGPMRDFEAGRHHITQDFGEVSQLGAKVAAQGIANFLDKFKQRFGEEEFKRCIANTTHVVANVPTRHLLDLIYEEIEPLMAQLRQAASVDLYFSATDKLGYSGPTSILLTLDKLLRTQTFKNHDTVLSFAIESSKWMNGGFIMEWRS